jgi:diguanylate cyclase (GGDEF)-like protein/PAS domain S-box-containing protein
MPSLFTLAALSRIRNRIILISMLGILLTGLLVGFSTTWPLYHSLRAQIEQLNFTSAQAQAAAMQNQIARYQSIAKQFTSRTEIRKRLQAYANGEMDLADLQAYTTPRLQDPLNQVPDLAAMVRLGPNQEIITRIGPLVDHIEAQPSLPQGIEIVATGLNQTRVLIRTSAPIYSDKGDLIGHDILYFTSAAIRPILAQFEAFGANASMCLVNLSQLQVLGLNPTFNAALLLEPTEAQQAELRQIAADQSGLYRFYTLNAKPQAVFHHPLGTSGWSLIVRIPEESLYHRAHLDLLWALLSILVMLAVGAFLSHRAIHPLIKQLLKQTDQIQQSALELRLAASVFENAQEPIIVTNTELVILRANQGFSQTLKLEHQQLINTHLSDYFCSECMQGLDLQRTAADHLQAENSWQGEVWYRTGDNQRIPALQTISAVRDDNEHITFLIHIFNDISEQKRAERKIHHQAHHDALTQLPNRIALMNHLQQLIDERNHSGYHFSLMFIDLDKFKPVNDDFGHQVGDELLKQVAERIKHSVRTHDMVGRLGGDEFLLIIERLQQAHDAKRIAQKIINSLSEPFSIEGREICIGASVGIAHYPQDGQNVDALIKQADAAMYLAKQSGRNRFACAQNE